MATTYVPITASNIGGSSTITFSSLGSYTDLRIVFQGGGSAGDALLIQLNGDTASNYDRTGFVITNTAASQQSAQSQGYVYLGDPNNSLNNMATIDIMNYRNAGNKNVLSQAKQEGNARLYIYANSWRIADAVTSVKFYLNSGTFTSGSTVSLYGILAA